MADPSAKAQETWLYVGEYPHVWSDSGQEWLYFEYPSQPAYNFNTGEWPVFFDAITLEQIVAPTSNHLILLHAGEHWMVVRFNSATMEEPAQIFEFAEEIPVMEGASHYTINERKNTMLLSLFLQDNEQSLELAVTLQLDFSYQDGGWFTMAAATAPGSTAPPSPINGFLPNTAGSFWFYSVLPEQLPQAE